MRCTVVLTNGYRCVVELAAGQDAHKGIHKHDPREAPEFNPNQAGRRSVNPEQPDLLPQRVIAMEQDFAGVLSRLNSCEAGLQNDAKSIAALEDGAAQGFADQRSLVESQAKEIEALKSRLEKLEAAEAASEGSKA